ncbi:MAG TPA: TetR/AcrR family transcriptional regulator [Acidocella sp.]|jgi:AcrR family transcriptional regulator|nr:TetR/AcrR family transcriptional regulator [Acidocella sp.]
MRQKPITPPGRPREFDRDEALHVAMKLFCKHGYEGVSIAELTAAMNISPPSLYAAFGSKEALFREALELYTKRPDLPHFRAASCIREQIKALLYDTVRAATDPDYPAGCMVVAGMLACKPENEELAESVADLRTARCEMVNQHLQEAVASGQLPPETDTQAVGRFIMALAQGIAIQAHDGAPAEELYALVDVALQNWTMPQPAG